MNQASTVNYWDSAHECMPVAELRELQLERLQKTVKTLWNKVPYYRQKMKALGVTPSDIRSLQDVQKLPFTTKEDLRLSYPYQAFAVPMEKVVRIHASSGTTGKSTVVGYTRRDMDNWSDLVARFLVAGGLTSQDIVHIAFGYGLFTGGFGLHYGAEKVGASVIPVSSGRSERQIQIMQDFGSTALVCTPSYAIYLAEIMQNMGVKASDLKLRLGFFGGEFWSHLMRKEIQEHLKIVATDNYGLSEVMGPGVSGECIQQEGMHIFEDHFLVELIDPSTGAPADPQKGGELVITTLTKEAIPVVRYRTRDLCAFLPNPCPCGRTFVRMSKISGRSDDMLIIRGVNVFPSQIEEVLLGIKGIMPHYQLVVSRDGALDNLEVHVEVSEGFFFDEMKKQQEFARAIEHKLENVVGVRARIKLVEPKTIERSEGKAKRVVDLRKLT
ncbi:MAG TPA: phenylacetate--CoA ligase [Verrucomicrobia bacterium]|nr:MAG: phenylacetate--CoA ligase [Lentisphaerae bacterium GWF2_57_35]HBA83149.1 phenylacetate--CoA ligase [Verrucomicrobiota bacterium]